MENPNHERWNNIAIALGAVCLLLIAVSEAVGFATTQMRNVLIVGLLVAGTIMWVIQAQKLCPHCGKKFGFSLRILKSYECRNCGRDIREEPD